MRELFFSDKGINRIKKNKARIEKKLNISIQIKTPALVIKSIKNDSFVEYISSKIIEAIAQGFDMETALQLENEEFIFNRINIKDLVPGHKKESAIGRIIGTQGKIKKILEELSDCDLVVTEPYVIIIGKVENVQTLSQAIISLAKGSKPANIYNFLEKNRARLKKLEEEDIEQYIEKAEKKNHASKNKSL